ncbi:MAG: FAD-dependent oxidoreductase [Anaerolineae bacterium]
MTTFGTDVLIIGAGLSGLMAARTLADAGKRVIVLDKGTRVGGRMNTRRMGGGLADDGAQFFTVREPEFRRYVDRWLADNLVFEWSRGWSDGSLADTRDGHPRYAVRNGMAALMEVLAQGLDVRSNTQVVALHRLAEGWQVTDSREAHYTARGLILTPPVPQSLELLHTGKVTLDVDQETALNGIDYEPCLTGLFLIDGEASLPSPGAIQRFGAQITWLCDNKRKGLSPKTLLTVQASPTYSRAMWERNDADIIASLRIDLMPFIGETTPIVEWQLIRWRYSLPTILFPERCMVAKGLPLVFGGDAFAQPRIEGAFLSGIAAGQAMLNLLP